jgi:predicted nucleotidyltransferase
MHENHNANKISTAMDKRDTIIDKVRAYKALVDVVFPVKIEQFYLYGSYAKGNPRKYSDIDVALVVGQLDDDYDILKTEPLLWKLTRQVDDRIEPILIARDTDYAGFLDKIQRAGILI